MVRDVREIIAQILKENYGLNLIHLFLRNHFCLFSLDIPNIDEYIKSMETSRRYLLDIWS